jgi:hypothetical protein
MRRLLFVFAVLAACGGDSKKQDDAGMPADAGQTTDGAAAPDARVAPSGVEVTGGAAVLESQSFTLEVQVGHGISQQPTTAGSTTVEGNSVIKR